ncbi:MAG: GlsB/YeaQ/YmgE family stress response membrane protein, partial [Clostridiales bacterium]|nr:GlsB/YeaQ/YmgE family stress response membrane protein [Clostridiales bacterium]
MDLTTILIWIVVGAIAGWLAGLIVNKETGLSLRDII